MKQFRVEYAKSYTEFNGGGIEIVPAESEEEAIELLKQHFLENDEDPDEYLFRVNNSEDLEVDITKI